MHINQIKYFLAITKYGSFFEAAIEEYISQSSLSKQIKSLEIELGVDLFNRERNKISLTEAGKVFYEHAKEMASIYTSIQADMSPFQISNSQEIKIAAIPIIKSYDISSLIAEFQKSIQKDNLTVNYNISEMEQKDVVKLIKESRIDFAIMRNSDFDDISKYERILFLRDEIGLICREDNPLAKMDCIDLSQLNNEDILLITPKSAIYNICMRELYAYNKDSNVKVTTTKHRILLSMVQNNVGITLFTRRSVQSEEFSDLKFISLKKPIYSNVYFVKQYDRKLNKVAEKLWSFLSERFSEMN